MKVTHGPESDMERLALALVLEGILYGRDIGGSLLHITDSVM